MHDRAVTAPLTAPTQTLPDPAPDSETACPDCPIRPLKLFHEPTGEELESLQLLNRRNGAWALAVPGKAAVRVDSCLKCRAASPCMLQTC